MNRLRGSIRSLFLTVVVGTLVAGCGPDNSQPTVVVPDQPPVDRAKSSMDFHKKQMEEATKKK